MRDIAQDDDRSAIQVANKIVILSIRPDRGRKRVSNDVRNLCSRCKEDTLQRDRETNIGKSREATMNLNGFSTWIYDTDIDGRFD